MTNKKKNTLVAAAIMGLMAAATAGIAGCGTHSCKGVGGCGGKNGCGGKDTATKVEDGQLKQS